MSVCSLVLNFLHGCTQYSVLQTYNEISFAQKYIYSVYFYMENLYNSPLLHQKPRSLVQMTFSWFFFSFFYLHLYTDLQFFQRVKEEAEIHWLSPECHSPRTDLSEGSYFAFYALFGVCSNFPLTVNPTSLFFIYASRGGSKAI